MCKQYPRSDKQAEGQRNVNIQYNVIISEQHAKSCYIYISVY